jgi:hypothetical protein
VSQQTNQTQKIQMTDHIENMDDDVSGADDAGGWCSVGCLSIALIIAAAIVYFSIKIFGG